MRTRICRPRHPFRYVHFIPSELPVLTSDHPAALDGAALALDRMGRSHLGGVLQVRAPGATSDAVRLAAARAVENALRGGSGTVTLHPDSEDS